MLIGCPAASSKHWIQSSGIQEAQTPSNSHFKIKLKTLCLGGYKRNIYCMNACFGRRGKYVLSFHASNESP